MARIPSLTDFDLKVDGVGSFVFGRRKLADEIKIQVEFARMVDGVEPTEWLSMVCTWLCTLKIMAVRMPEDFIIDELDPLDDGTYAKLAMVHSALAAKEGSFRRGTAQAGQGTGAGERKDDGVLVPPQVRADA